MATNRELIRLLEGYGQYNPVWLLKGLELRRFRKLSTEIQSLEAKLKPYYLQSIDIPPLIEMRYINLLEKRRLQFPDKEESLMPTALGNTITAFEVYPLVMYGIDAVNGWLRLLAVIPVDYRQLVDSAKAQMDLWINLWFASFLGLIAYGGLFSMTGRLPAMWLPLLFFTFLFLALWQAQLSAAAWGGYVKSAFDVFLPELDRKLRISSTDPAPQQAEVRVRLSQAFAYVEPEYLPNAHNQSSGDKT